MFPVTLFGFGVLKSSFQVFTEQKCFRPLISGITNDVAVGGTHCHNRDTDLSPNSYSPSKTISLSKSAKALSNFVSAETGGSQAVSSYLTRASASFNALVQFHKELKNSKFDHIKSTNNENPVKYKHKSEENEVGLIIEGSVGSYSARKRHKQSRKKNDSFVIEEVGEVVDSA
ncbi:hypothetical protein ACSBR1_039190 [Camellia fascicularis]